MKTDSMCRPGKAFTPPSGNTLRLMALRLSGLQRHNRRPGKASAATRHAVQPYTS
ncbi:hypothetical protein [Citrobacter koseri]|uniref:hypothetical protein n=1 Tax=Citrobacter koseri TaxID=545 RepID=UPI003891C446